MGNRELLRYAGFDWVTAYLPAHDSLAEVGNILVAEAVKVAANQRAAYAGFAVNDNRAIFRDFIDPVFYLIDWD